MNARVKLLLTLAFILSLSLSLSGAWPSFILFFTFNLVVAQISRVGIGLILKRALVAFPFVLAALPLVFSGPTPLLPLFHNSDILYSAEGVERFLSIAIKSWLSLQAAILLSATTRFSDLVEGLHALKVPAIFIAILNLMQRYILVMVDEVTRMLQARSSRSGYGQKTKRTTGSVLWRAKISGGMAGSWLLRSIERSERVFAAMQSRGYNGTLPVSQTRNLLPQERVFLLAGLGLILLIWLFGLISGA